MRRSFRNLIAVTIAGTLLAGLLAGCGEMKGEVEENLPPQVSFTTVPQDGAQFDFAPVIYWKGSDPDGFVDHYSYADVTDQAALENPEAFIRTIPDEAWVDTIATQATVYLLTEEGDTTEHVFYVRCVDNEGAYSEVAYRRFFRTNNPPNTPKIGLVAEGVDQDTYGPRFVVQDTLFSAPEVTNFYPGITFAWRGSDPDDRALYKIPLEFQAVLVRSPNDTVFVGPWTDEQEINLVDLQTGYYTLNVWSRDDGLTRSLAPARAEFYVIRPTFEHNMLFVMEHVGNFQNLPEADSARAYYEGILQELAPQLQFTDLSFDGRDVRFMQITDDAEEQVVPRSLIHQYKLVVFSSDNFKLQPFSGNYRNRKLSVMEDYLSVGGRIWMQGRMLGKSVVAYSDQSEEARVMERFFGVEEMIYEAAAPIVAGDVKAEFIATRSGLAAHPNLDFDSTKAGQQWNAGYVPGSYGLTGAEIVQRTPESQTVHYFLSNTADSTSVITGEEVAVVTSVQLGENTNINYPPTATNCYLQTANGNLESVDRVINFSRTADQNRVGEVVIWNDDYIFISYDEGQPWYNYTQGGGGDLFGDSIVVDYTYDPISQNHLKPSVVRYEGTQQSNFLVKLRFRTAVSTFSYYYMSRQQVLEDWQLMLDWFYNPALNR